VVGIFLYPFDKRNPENPGKLRCYNKQSDGRFLMDKRVGFADTARDVYYGKLNAYSL